MSMHRWLAIAAIVLAGAAFAGHPAPVHAQQGNEKIAYAAISGQVQPLQFAQVGQTVRQGDILLFVRTSTGGAIPAARAPVDGTVVRVLVNIGDSVNIGDAVAVIAPK